MTRFDPTNDELRRSLLVQSRKLTDLQARIVEARKHVLANGADPVLLAIIDTRTETDT